MSDPKPQTLRAGTQTRGAPTGPREIRFSFDVSDGRICDSTAAAGLRAPAHRGARDDGPGALDHRDHATDIRPRVCAGQILRGAVRQQVEDRRPFSRHGCRVDEKIQTVPSTVHRGMWTI